ncbi:hypothetical protein PB01_13500 [Psychrobacillus glaciei]|uniref:Uncharacterized protein n=1 Tax=Psychrobacillus glaciei TaxID=2283160 RepID=A0A5J6SSB2_9BACI|nr:hypothetical protein [Psychrobacillus glaciei]QFF99774.1 hypothetical protein PB01_13500 [Psychrobacillus glaciei]
MSKIINRKGNETDSSYRNVSSLLNQSPQQKSKQNIAQNREEGNENYKLEQKTLSEENFAQEKKEL